MVVAALFFLIFTWPIFILIGLLILLFGGGWPVVFQQERVGKDGRVFKIWKFRTMVKGAEKLKEKYQFLNEASGPVFKIRDDPRFTKIGKFLAHSGLDELLQLVNVLKGEMAFIGPRPLPVGEDRRIPKKYRKTRHSVLPGIISPWIFIGYHKISFTKWMESDIKYVKEKSFWRDWLYFFKGSSVFFNLVITSLKEQLNPIPK